jgi:trigger factor
MQVSVETLSGLERRLRVTVPALAVESRIVTRISEAARRVRLPGFRPGHVPLKEVRRRYGRDIRAEVIADVMRESFASAAQQESLRVAAPPRLSIDSPGILGGPGEDLAFSAVFEILPSIDLVPFARVRVEKPRVTIGEADVDRMVERLRVQRKQWAPVAERAAERGDAVRVSFAGRIDGEPFEGGSSEDARFEIGSAQAIPGFEEGLVGARAGETRTVEATFPADFGNAALRGRQATFEVRVIEVLVGSLPDVDAAFMEGFGVAGGDVAQFRADVRSSMERELDNALRAAVKRQVIAELATHHQPKLPQALVRNEIERMRQETAQRFGIGAEQLAVIDRAQAAAGAHDHDHDHDHDHGHEHGHRHDHGDAHEHAGHDPAHDHHAHDHSARGAAPPATAADTAAGADAGGSAGAAAGAAGQPAAFLPPAMFLDAAERRVCAGLVLTEIVNRRKLAAEPQRVRAMISALATAYDDPEAFVRFHYENEEALARIEQAVLEDQVIDVVMAEATVTEVDRTYEEVVAPRQPGGRDAAASDTQRGEATP